MTTPTGATFTDVSAPFLPTDPSTMASEGALKLPDLGADAENQLALQGFFAPTGVVQNGILSSVDPRPLEPRVAIVAYQGYLGLDSGRPQSVYSIDSEQIDRGALERGRLGQPRGRRDADPARRHGDHVHRLLASSPPCSCRTTRARCGCSAPPSPSSSGCWPCSCSAASACSPASAPAPGGGGTVLTVGSLTRGGGEGGERFAGLTDDLRAALAARVPARPTPPAGGAPPDPEVPTP